MKNFFSGLLMLALAAVLQSFAASFAYSFDLVLASLIAFAFVFAWREFLPLIAFGIFILNWQPAPSAVIFVYALLPLVLYALHALLSWESLAGIGIASAVAPWFLALAAGVGIATLGAGPIILDMLAMGAWGLGLFSIIAEKRMGD